MDKLPAEAKDMICGSLSYKDAATFRLVCKDFASIGARHSHRKLVVNVTPGHMEKIRNIAATSALAMNVEYLAIDSNIALYFGPAATDLNVYIEYYIRSRGFNDPMITKQQLQEAFNKIVSYTRGIEALWGKNLVGTLQTMVEIFPRLKKLEIAPYLRDRDGKDPSKLRDFKQAVVRVNSLNMPEQILRRTHQNELNDALAQVVLPASLQSLTMAFFRMAHQPLPNVRYLRTLELNASASPIIHTPLYSMFLCASLPQGSLTNLCLEGINFDRNDLLQFLDVNQKSLKCVKIRACKIDRTSWDCLYAYLTFTSRPKAFIMGADYVPSSWENGTCIHRHFESVEESGASASHCRIKDMVSNYLEARDVGTLRTIDPKTASKILERMGIEYPGRQCRCKVLRFALSKCLLW